MRKGGRPVQKVQHRQSQVVEPSPEELTEIKEFSGNIITSPSGMVPISPAQMQFVALLDFPNSPVLIVSKSNAKQHEVSTAKSLLRRRGFTWRKEFLVGLDVVRSAYERSGIFMGSSGEVPMQAVAMEKAFINLLSEAAALGTSDIHIFVRRYEAEVKFRVDNLLTRVKDMTAIEASELCQSAFNMADASDPTYMPNEQQGARINEAKLKSLNFKGDVQSLRLQFNPLAGGGRHMVARLLYNQKVGSNDDVDTLGYTKSQIDQIKKMRRRPVGVNVISGPTGSGKSTTLQRGLTALMREKSGLATLTIEDPPEYIIEGAAQIPVTNAQTAEERAEKFRAAIAGALRSDPNIIMIGEIRDASSAKLAFEAAMTGHAVWTTLHANDAVSIIDRLRDLNVELFKLCDPSNMSGLIGQRLVRRSVKDREISFEEGVEREFLPVELVKKIRVLCGDKTSGIRFAGANELDPDYDSYFSGRTVVAEVIVPDQEFLDLMRNDSKAKAIKHWQTNLEGLTMLEHGLLRVMRGEVDPREIESNIGFISEIEDERGAWIRERLDRL
ncbi:hypothetical protein E1297_16440 [Roseibium sp. RKSG952]|nr:hypothetical protein [Roseibium sp. RKSG952]